MKTFRFDYVDPAQAEDGVRYVHIDARTVHGAWRLFYENFPRVRLISTTPKEVKTNEAKKKGR